MFEIFQYVHPVYRCPFCGSEHNDFDVASNCINSHAKPQELLGYNGFDEAHQIPNIVYVELSDGRIGRYHLASVSPKEQDADEDGSTDN